MLDKLAFLGFQNPKIRVTKMEEEEEQVKKTKIENHNDFISDLPDSVLHHILSFLDMIFIARTSILSKRWRYLWRSTHFLNFNEEVFNTEYFIIDDPEPITHSHSHSHSHEEEEEDPFCLDIYCEDPFMDFVNRAVLLHCKSNINTFCISGVDPRAVPRLWTWMNYNPWLEIRRDEEESDNRRTLNLPICFFNSNTLTTLKLDMGSMKGRPIFKIPDLVDSVSLPCLKTLHLLSVLLVDGDTVGSFFSRCLALETLIISNCLLEEKNNLIISGFQLKKLEIGISCVKSTCIGENGKVTVCAPKLTSFNCRDVLLSEFYLDVESVFAALVEADIDACLMSRPECLCRFSPDHSPQRKAEYNQNVFKCLRNVCNVESLSLFMHLLEDTLGVRSGFEGLLNPFCNLRVLKLKTVFCGEHILNIAVLEMCPHLKSLILERTSGPIARPFDQAHYIFVDKVIEPWEMKAPLHCLYYNLNFIEIRGAYGTFDEFIFLRFLLKNAMVLAKLVIFTCECDVHHSFERCLERFSEKLLTLPKASSNVEISLFNSPKLLY